MEFTLNDTHRTTAAERLSVQALLDSELPDKQQGIAVAINDSVIPRIHWADTFIQKNDQVLIITATQGG